MDQSSPDAPLERIGYLVGGTWTAQGEFLGLGAYTAERSYRWTLGGKFIEQRNVIRFSAGESVTRGIIGWDPDQGAIVAWGFGDDGGIATSRAWRVTETEISFEGVRVGGFISGPIRATSTRVNDDAFIEVAEAKISGDWMPMFSFSFTRRDGQ